MKCPKCGGDNWHVAETILWIASDDENGGLKAHKARSSEINSITCYDCNYSVPDDEIADVAIDFPPDPENNDEYQL